MDISGETIIGELVADNYRAAQVFKKYKIDFCCQGGRTISDACVKNALEVSQVVSELKNSYEAKTAEIDYNKLELDDLADYIKDKHHSYVVDNIPVIQQYLNKVCRVHGEHHPELHQVKYLFDAAADELINHMQKEELILFPEIKNLVHAKRGELVVDNVGFGSVYNPIHVMKEEHENEGHRFRKIAELTNDYQPPAEACNTYRVVFGLLKEFEEDLHLHIHLENNILFPKSIQIEGLS